MLFKNLAKRYIPDELIQIYYSFHQKRFEHSNSIPKNSEVLIVGPFTYGAENLKILFRDSGEKVIVGKFCSIAKDVTILLGGGHRHDWVTTYPFGLVFQEEFGTEQRKGQTTSKGSVVIGNDVWIGTGTTIMSGVKVGDGAVIAANSHIVHDVPSYGIVGGNPAALIKFRFDDATIKRLLEIRWYEFPELEIDSIKMMLTQIPNESVLSSLESIRIKLESA